MWVGMTEIFNWMDGPHFIFLVNLEGRCQTGPGRSPNRRAFCILFATSLSYPTPCPSLPLHARIFSPFTWSDMAQNKLARDEVSTVL